VANPSPATRNYACSPGEITIDVRTEEQWHQLAICIGRPELAYKGSWEVVRTSAEDGPTARVLEEMFAEDTAESWLRRLDAHGVPCVIAGA
jgi:crotonobetainyl-CoA:carnitine CoA-transferase CaiB-like acyl-CoA transferase